MVISLRIVKTASVLVCLAEHRLSRVPPGLPRPRDRATPPPHGSPRCHRRKNGRRRRTRRAGGVERCPPGDGFLDPRERGEILGKGGFSIISGGISLPGSYFSCPGFWVSVLYGRRFFPGMEHYHPPPRNVFVHPRTFMRLAQQLTALRAWCC